MIFKLNFVYNISFKSFNDHIKKLRNYGSQSWLQKMKKHCRLCILLAYASCFPRLEPRMDVGPTISTNSSFSTFKSCPKGHLQKTVAINCYARHLLQVVSHFTPPEPGLAFFPLTVAHTFPQPYPMTGDSCPNAARNFMLLILIRVHISRGFFVYSFMGLRTRFESFLHTRNESLEIRWDS